MGVLGRAGPIDGRGRANLVVTMAVALVLTSMLVGDVAHRVGLSVGASAVVGMVIGVAVGLGCGAVVLGEWARAGGRAAFLARKEAVRSGVLPVSAEPRSWLPWLELHAAEASRGRWLYVVYAVVWSVLGSRWFDWRGDPVGTAAFALSVAGAVAAAVYYAVYCARYMPVIRRLITELAMRWDVELHRMHES